MAKFRRNHERRDKSGFGGLMIRVFIFMILLGVGFVWLYRSLNSVGGTRSHSNTQVEINPISDANRNYIPSDCKGERVDHDHYSLCYVEDLEIASWVAYPLTAQSLNAKNVKRSKRYHVDPMVSTQSAKHGDYTHSGYTRGHLAPAGDMAFDQRAMKQCFYMSNMTPQLRGFNNGIWKELEENVRDWALDKGMIYVVTGPIMGNNYKTIGYNEIAIPPKFYKILYDPSTEESIAYIMENQVLDRPIDDYATSVDEVEMITGINFFDELIDDSKEEEIESRFNVRKWKTDKRKYKSRVEIWNKQR